MTSLYRIFPVLMSAVICLVGTSAFGATGTPVRPSKAPAELPFTVNLAPGDAIVHGSQREENNTEDYQQQSMDAGDEVVGLGGAHRSVILTGDASAVEVMPGSRLRARQDGGRAYLELVKGVTRVGRASFGDGTPIRLMIRTRKVGAVIHGGDLMVSKGNDESATVMMPESDTRYLYSERVSLQDVGSGGYAARTKSFRPTPSRSYSDLGVAALAEQSWGTGRYNSRLVAAHRRHHHHRAHTHMRNHQAKMGGHSKHLLGGQVAKQASNLGSRHGTTATVHQPIVSRAAVGTVPVSDDGGALVQPSLGSEEGPFLGSMMPSTSPYSRACSADIQ